jgi:CheY-like chemotaxis protein
MVPWVTSVVGEPGVKERQSALIVDDAPDIRALLSIVLELSTEFDCYEAADGTRALELWREHRHDIIVLDQAMPGMTGLEVATDILRLDPSQPVILFSAHLDAAMREKARALGVQVVLDKSQFGALADALHTAGN